MLRKPILLIAAGILMLIASGILKSLAKDQQDFGYALEGFKSFLKERATDLDENTRKLTEASCPDFSETSRFRKVGEKGLYWFAYTNEDILFWSGNSVPLTSDMIRNKSDTLIWKLKNGWYLAKRYPGKNCTLLGLALIRHEYSYQNEYLVNGWYNNQQFPLQLTLPDEKSPSSFLWKEPLSNNLMGIGPSEPTLSTSNSSPPPSGVLGFIIAGLLLIFAGGHQLFAFSKLRDASFWWLFLLGSRLASFFLHEPITIYDLTLFSPSDYAASDWLPTLGDLLLNTSLVVYATFLLFIHRNSLPRFSSRLGMIMTIMLLYAATVFATGTVRSLIVHSSIALDFSDIFNISSSSFIAYLIIVMLFAAIYLAAETIQTSRLPGRYWKGLPYLVTIGFTLIMVFSTNMINGPEPDILILSGCLMLILLLPESSNQRFRYTRIIGLMTIFALAGNYLILHDTSAREKEKRKLLAIKISAERDPIAESLFREIEDEILNDTLLKSYLRPTTVIPPGQVRDLAQLYFNGYWEKYNIVVSVFGTDECPLTSLYTTPVSDPLIFDRLIDSIGIPTQSEHFFYMDKGSGRISYFARLQIPDTHTKNVLGTIYIDFQSRYTPEEIGYPELLLDQMVTSNTDMSNYSYARYKEGNLVSHFGNYSYPLRKEVKPAPSNEPFRFIREGNYEHLYYQASPLSMVVLSLPERNFIALLTPFSYLMLISGILVLLVLLISELRKPQKLVISFKRRIQFFIVGILLLTLFLVSAGTLLFLTSNNINKNQRAISEKIHSVLVETEYNLFNDESLNLFKANDVGYLLTRQANIFFADINLFDPSGQLFASSRPKIFEEGLVSKKMHPEALFEMKYKQNTEFIHEEQTGLLQYLSAYVPVRNRENKVIAYLNLPYFAKQSELKREISVFLVTIINIYVLLIVLVVIAAIFLSNRITEPLRLIQERLGSIRLGRKNEAIAWKGNDEIANLIAEYNRMVNELALSADKLARSERESAWREMAKQVAHEIKNPLTPIKLSIQHLNKAWNDKAPDFELRLERFSRTLIEQIDTLSHIATEFSNFAQMPRMVLEKVDLNDMLHNIVDFFSHAEEFELHYSSSLSENCLVLSDREQLLRVFNNLIRNAIQSIPENRKGKIEVHLSRENNFWLITVSDNGSGIPDQIREKIFYPNFTTRTGGMGLGLSLVKNIVESSGGMVDFSSQLSLGSTFFVKLPVLESMEVGPDKPLSF